MRPLDKGTTPLDINGNPITPTDYKKWRKSLIDRIGYYCAYCNMPLSHSLQVEHVIPRNPPAGYTIGDALAWDNMLLACGPCNNAKNNSPIDESTYYLPEEHNTHLPFDIVSITNHNNIHAIVEAKSTLNATQKQKAINTISLLDLGNIDERNNIVDLRSRKRKEAILLVQSARLTYDGAKDLLNSVHLQNVVNLLAKCAVQSGFFSLWYQEFSNEPLVLEKLIDNSIIPGTAQNCFDPNQGYQPINRNPQNSIDPF